MPEKRWKKVFINACDSIERYYNTFNHGTAFFGTKSVESTQTTTAFFSSIIENASSAELDNIIVTSLNVLEEGYGYIRYLAGG